MKCGSTETSSGKPCGRTAGWGTDHVGEGLCRWHDDDTPDDDGLTHKQRRFVEEYPVDCNATQAAIRAGYSEHTAGQIGYQLLQETSISDAIQERVRRLAMGPDEALKLVGDMARESIEDCVDILPDGRFKINLKKAKEKGVLSLIQELGYDRSGNPKIKMYDRKGAIDMLLRAHGAYRDTLDVNLHGQVEIIDFSASDD